MNQAGLRLTNRLAELGEPASDPEEVETLRAELAAARGRARAAEKALADLEERKRIMECQWVNQTLALYQEFEGTLRPRVRRAENERDAVVERASRTEFALAAARAELEKAWEQNEEQEQQHKRSLELLARTSSALQSQLRLLRALEPVLKVFAHSPAFSKKRGDMDEIFCRAAVIKALRTLSPGNGSSPTA